MRLDSFLVYYPCLNPSADPHSCFWAIERVRLALRAHFVEFLVLVFGHWLSKGSPNAIEYWILLQEVTFDHEASCRFK